MWYICSISFIIKSFISKFEAKGITYKFISEKDKGIYDAWNKGIALSEGQWISFLGSDDMYIEDALINYSNEINKSDGKTNYISSKVEIIDHKAVFSVSGLNKGIYVLKIYYGS